MTKPRRPGRRLLGDIDPAHFGDPIAELRLFADCKTSEELRDVLRAEVNAEVKAMLTLLEDADAFDVIELMRMREFPTRSALGRDVGGVGSQRRDRRSDAPRPTVAEAEHHHTPA